MKTGGIIGGVSWHSTIDLYRYVNEHVGRALGGLNCAKLVLINVNLNDIKFAPDDDAKAAVLMDAARRIEKAGGEFVVICSNGLHEYADKVQSAVDIPLIHIADGTAEAILRAGYNKIGFLGAKRTMEKAFYTDRLRAKGIEPLIPEAEDRQFIDDVVFKETALGIVKPESCARFYRIAEGLYERGAQGVILGCTEIGMLMQQEHTSIPLFDTTQIHAETIANLLAADR